MRKSEKMFFERTAFYNGVQFCSGMYLNLLYILFIANICCLSGAAMPDKTCEYYLSELSNTSLSKQQLLSIESELEKNNHLAPVEVAKIQIKLGEMQTGLEQDSGIDFLNKTKDALKRFQQTKSRDDQNQLINTARSDYETAKLVARRYERERKYNQFMYVLDNYSTTLIELSQNVDPQIQTDLFDIASESWVYAGVKLVFRKKDEFAYGYITNALEKVNVTRNSIDGLEKLTFQLKCAKSITSAQSMHTTTQEINELIDKHADSPWLAEAFWELSDLFIYNTEQRYGFLTKILEICEENPNRYTKLDMVYCTLAHDAKMLRFNQKSIMYYNIFLEKYPEHPWRSMAERDLKTVLEKDQLLLDNIELAEISNVKSSQTTFVAEKQTSITAAESPDVVSAETAQVDEIQEDQENQYSTEEHEKNSVIWWVLSAITLGVIYILYFYIKNNRSNL